MAGRGGGDAEDIILQLCNKHAAGITQDLIQQTVPDLNPHDIGIAVNSLTASSRLQIFKQEDGGQPIFKAVDVAEAIKVKGLSAEEMLVHQEITKSANQGLWTKEMRNRTNLSQAQITKILRTLEGRKLIKVVKSVGAANRKVYMSYEIEPAKEITGGAWYTDHELDDEMIDSLRKGCLAYLRRNETGTVAEISNWLKSKGLVNNERVTMGPDEWETVLKTLVLDGELERLVDTGSEDTYCIAALPMMESTALTSMPCGVCPVVTDCTPDGAISPSTCEYFQKWLEF